MLPMRTAKKELAHGKLLTAEKAREIAGKEVNRSVLGFNVRAVLVPKPLLVIRPIVTDAHYKEEKRHIPGEAKHLARTLPVKKVEIT